MLWYVVVLGSVVAVLVTATDVVLLPLGVIAVLTGLTLATDLRGGADASAALVREMQPRAGSLLGGPVFSRVLGAVLLLVGGGFVVAGVSAL